MMRFSWSFVLCLVTFLLASARADEVHFNNGDRLTGTVVTMAEGKLKFKTQVAGDVNIDVTTIATLSTDEPVEIHFSDGTVVRQRILPVEEGGFAIEESAVLESQRFALADVVLINPPPPVEPRWKGSASLGMSSSQGNSETDDFSFTLGLDRASERDRVKLGAGYLFGRQKDPDTGVRSTSEDNWFISGKYDYFLENKYFLFGNSRVERDQVADLDLRFILGGGGGYFWINRPGYVFSTELGLSWRYENYAGESDSGDLNLQLSYGLERGFAHNLVFLHDFYILPAISDWSDYYLNTSAELRTPLSRLLYANLRLVLSYDSTPAADKDRTDFKYILGLGSNF